MTCVSPILYFNCYLSPGKGIISIRSMACFHNMQLSGVTHEAIQSNSAIILCCKSNMYCRTWPIMFNGMTHSSVSWQSELRRCIMFYTQNLGLIVQLSIQKRKKMKYFANYYELRFALCYSLCGDFTAKGIKYGKTFLKY